MTEQLHLDLTAPPEPAAASSLPDEAARARIAADLHENQFVEAGAGAGKTGRLVARIVALVASGVPVERIAAITFTEKAAAELRHRLVDGLVAAGHHEAATAVPHAAIGTLHAFARRLLQTHPVEAGLPPRFTVLDEVASDLAFAQRWSAFLDGLVSSEERTRLVALCDLDDIRFEGLRQIAVAFGDNWDLVERRVDLTRPAPTPLDPAGFADQIRALVSPLVAPPDDTMAERLRAVSATADALRYVAQFGEPLDAAPYLLELATARDPARVGNKAKWKAHGGEAALGAARQAVTDVGTLARTEIDRLRDERRFLVGAELGRFTLEAAAERQRLGELEFHDLLVLARRLVATHPEVRAQLHERFTHVLLDEFQDTDPIQLELAVFITAAPDDPGETWWQRRPLPGRLFVVGDPKQSIYRFRRADIAQYLAARANLPATPLTLSANFRTVAPLLGWVNHTFERLIVGEAGVQPEFVALDAVRHGAPDHLGTVVLGAAAHDDDPPADELRAREAADVAAAVRTAVIDGWTVEVDGVTRPCRWGDIAIVLPARTSLPVLEAALREAGVPARAENSSLVYAADEVRDLLLALRAIDDPSDELALVSTLRSALYGCSDVDLYRWRQRGGRWNLGAPRPERLADDPVFDAFDSLADLLAARHRLTASQLLERLVDERRVLEVAVAAGDTRDRWRRVRFVVDQARAWAEAGGVGIRGFLEWTQRQGAEGRYVADVVLPETDHDAVRILTIHAAKGLEFPIVVVSGLSTRPSTERGVSVVWPDDTWDLRLSRGRSGQIYEDFKPLDEQMGHAERLRLLYVACTRARDHLVVSLHRAKDRLLTDDDIDRATSAELLAAACAGCEHQRTLAPSLQPLPAPAFEDRELPWEDPAVWAAERARAVAAASRPGALGASRLAAASTSSPPGLVKDPVDLDLPPWQRGRYGTAVGRAVHAVLQAADLATGADIAELARVQAGAEGVISRTDLVERLARSALGCDAVRAAASGAAHWRELYLAARFGDLVLEGYVDLLVRTPAGLEVVDYKTDSAESDEALAAKVATYRDQLAAYGLLVEAVTGETPVAGTLVFCAEHGATEVSVPDWPAALAGLRARFAAGSA